MEVKKKSVTVSPYFSIIQYPFPIEDVSQSVQFFPDYTPVIVPIRNTQGRVREVPQDVPVIVPVESSTTDVVAPRSEESYKPVTGIKRVGVRKYKPVYAPWFDTKYKPSTSYSTTDDVYEEYAPHYSYEYAPRFKRVSVSVPVFDQVNYDPYYYAVSERQKALWRVIREAMR